MSYGYGGQQNPFDDRAAANYGGNVEMSSLPQGGNANPNAILNECRDIDQGINTIEQNLNQMRMFQQRTLDDADSSAGSNSNRQLDSLSTETMAHYRSLTERVRMVKSNPDSKLPKNSAQVQRVDRRLKAAIQSYQTNESDFRKKTQDQMARQYRIVRPDADENEVREAVQDTGGQVFQQALMQSNRRGQAQSVLSAVQDRQAQLQKIEQQLIELAQLFQDMDTLVVQQEAAVTNIEQKAEETVENFDKGNQEVETAIGTARATRKKKWWCLLIAVIIIVIIVVAVVAYVMINKPKENNNPAKRSIKLFRGQTVQLEGRAWDESNPVPQMLTARTDAKQDMVQDIKDPEAWLSTLVTREDKPIAKRWVDNTKKFVPFVPEERALPAALGHVFVSVDDEEK